MIQNFKLVNELRESNKLVVQWSFNGQAKQFKVKDRQNKFSQLLNVGDYNKSLANYNASIENLTAATAYIFELRACSNKICGESERGVIMKTSKFCILSLSNHLYMTV